MDFLSGELQIFQFYDLTHLEKLALSYRHNLEITGTYEMFVKFMSMDEADTGFGLSQHFVNRIFFEYLSPEWLFSSQFQLIGPLKELIDNDKLNLSK